MCHLDSSILSVLYVLCVFLSFKKNILLFKKHINDPGFTVILRPQVFIVRAQLCSQIQEIVISSSALYES